jgi:hypothetical protein
MPLRGTIADENSGAAAGLGGILNTPEVNSRFGKLGCVKKHESETEKQARKRSHDHEQHLRHLGPDLGTRNGHEGKGTEASTPAWHRLLRR